MDMGVLSDGTPFLGSRALARMCGVVPSTIIGWTKNWSPEASKPRDLKLAQILKEQGYTERSLIVPIRVNGQLQHAHPEAVCLSVLMYYAEEVAQARHALGVLARRSFRDFVYSGVGYDPKNEVPESWRHFHDRLLLNPVPVGYFSAFRETADIIVSAINVGLRVDEHTVPDISVGQLWSKHWEQAELENVYGPRAKYPHVYPSYFPQSRAACDAWIYPVEALPDFRHWMHREYLPSRYPRYIATKVKAGALAASRADLLLRAAKEVNAPALPG